MVRVSSKGQTDGHSPEVQEKLGRAYVRKQNGRVVELYDGVESGTKPLSERQILQKVLRDAHSDKWDALWVLDQSRLTRSPDTLIAIAAAFKVARLELHTANGRAQLETPEGEFHAGIQSQSDRFFAQKIAQRTRDSRLEMLSKGVHAFGRHPWGRVWKKEQEKWEIDEKKHAQIQRAYDLYVRQDRSVADVAKKLGMPRSSLLKAFDSAGITEWHRSINTPEGVQRFVLTIPALLSAAQVNAIRHRRHRNRTVRPGATRQRSLLQGLIRCWHCGGKLSRMPSRKGNGKDDAVYRHLPATRGPKCLWHVPADLIEDTVVSACALLIQDNKQLLTSLRAGVEAGRYGLQDARARLVDIQKRLPELHRRVERAQAELLNFEGSAAACNGLRNEMKRLSAAISDLEIEQREVVDRIELLSTPLTSAKGVADRIRALVGLHGVAALRLTPEQKRRLLVIVIGRDSEVSPNGVFIRMSRIHGPRKAVWFWELRGSLAQMEGGASRYENLERGPSILQRKALEPGAINKLAELTRNLKPLPVKSATSCSSGA